MTLDARARKSAEIVQETNFGVLPSDPTMLGWGGYAKPISIKQTPTMEKNSYLKGVDSTNRMLATKTDKVSEELSASITAKPTSLEMLPFILGGTDTSDFTAGDDVKTFSIGTVVGDEYEVFGGAIFNKMQYKFEGEKGGEFTAEMKIAGSNGIVGTDYINAGSHAGDPSGDILKLSDVTNVLYDGASLKSQGGSLESLMFGVEVPAEPIKDNSATWDSNIAGWNVGQMNLSIELGVSLDDLTIAKDILDGLDHTLSFQLDGKTFSYSDFKLEGEFDKNLDPEDLLGTTLKATNIQSLSIT